MTLGRGHFGPLNLALLAAAALAGALLVGVERRAASPLIAPAMLRHPALAAGLASSALVMTVMTTTLVVGPFYLSRGIGLSAMQVGLAMAAGPAMAILTGVPAGYLVDRWGAQRIAVIGLAALTCGVGMLSMTAARQGIWGYIAPLCLLTTGYALFQVANNTALMKELFPQRRGAIAGMLNLARNLGALPAPRRWARCLCWRAAAVTSTPPKRRRLPAACALPTARRRCWRWPRWALPSAAGR